ncbi:MAG: hypothetical protein DRP09_13800 [Candidatus Thorarchaeota archaeon]|nr:MAG: hypothetical protein DRP09_13800 [Candidatus Thorarchaeota archaeon]
MILKALIDQLKTGSITNVYTRGNYLTYLNGRNVGDLLEPYVIVYKDYPVNAYYTVNNTIDPYVVEVHFPTGMIDQVDAYIENEIVGLLHRKRLVDDLIYNFQVYVTMSISILAEPNDDKSITGGNDDGTISRYRRIFVPRRGL